MITEKHGAEVPEEYLTAMGLDPADCLYFDIETTGLKAETSHLYLIGCAFRGKAGSRIKTTGSELAGGWETVQFFAENSSEEKQILERFADLCGVYHTILQFNGDRFDIPYLEAKYREYGMSSPFEGMKKIDLYRLTRPYRNLLGLERLNQKTIEKFLGITRKDLYNGGQLIQVYRAYRDGWSDDRTGDLRKLMLHNYEDVLGMLSLTKLLSYPLAFEEGTQTDRRKLEVNILRERQADASSKPQEQEVLEIRLRIPVPVPVPVDTQKKNCHLEIREDCLRVTVPVREGELLYFFQDYKNYYYLPEEDRAVHKSVSQFVDRRHRVKATADNCYVRVFGRFLPVPENSNAYPENGPIFHEYRKEKTGWIRLTDELLSSLRSGGSQAEEYLNLLTHAFG